MAYTTIVTSMGEISKVIDLIEALVPTLNVAAIRPMLEGVNVSCPQPITFEKTVALKDAQGKLTGIKETVGVVLSIVPDKP